MEEIINSWLTNLFGASVAETWTSTCSVVAVAVIAWISYIACIRILTPIVNVFTRRTANDWDDDLLNPHVLKAFSQLMPAICVAILLPGTFNLGEKFHTWIVRLTELYILWASIHLIVVFLRGVQCAFDRRQLLRQHNLEIVRQTIVLFIIIIGIIIGLGILINRDPLAILAGLGASAAVLMLVFRDTILGLVAGVQLTVNKMLAPGDWIVANKAGANGEVIEIKLTTIKVRNWDNSIVTLNPYTLFTDSFQNYNAMRQSGARRVARSIYIDQTTIRFSTPEEISSLREEGLVDESVSDEDRVVNLTLLRRYMERWLESNPLVIHAGTGRPELTLMARQLQPTPQGIPFELYFFTSLTQWKPFEHLQADVFDHLYAIIPRFGLSTYQAPSSNTFTQS